MDSVSNTFKFLFMERIVRETVRVHFSSANSGLSNIIGVNFAGKVRS